ncbi:MAG: uracil phosphoribosyltransferase [Planctomycetota bacterium]
MEPSSRGPGFERSHRYGDRVHILDNVYLLSALARIGAPDTPHRDLMSLLRSVYQTLFTTACGRELASVDARVPTRMVDAHPHAGHWHGRVFDPQENVVIVDIIRAGIVPAQVCFELATAILPERRVRLDHLTMARLSDEEGRVTGVDLSGSKIGGSVEHAVLFLPDPMGATGATTLRALRHYRAQHGTPRKIVALPMIATPEYLRAVLEEFETLVVYTARLDRGLSDPDVLATVPGTHWDRERGLDSHSYIVPGAGGMGEVINNAFC